MARLPSRDQLARRLRALEITSPEAEDYAQLLHLFANRAAPDLPDRPRAAELRDRLRFAMADASTDDVEERFLEYYAYLHDHQAVYTPAERHRVDATGGYWAHAGGISPVLRGARYLTPDSVALDLGAGTGLQGLLLQVLRPHRLTIQLEISRQQVIAGRRLQRWLRIPERRVAWAVTDITDVTVREVDLVYLYRPVRPDRPLGDRFYRRLVADLVASDRPVTVLSVADPLDELLPPAVTRVSDDGHLAIFRHEPVPPVASTAMADRSSASTVPSSVQSGFPGTDAP